MQIISTSLQTDNHTSTSSLYFFRPDALPDAQPKCQSTEGHCTTMPPLVKPNTRSVKQKLVSKKQLMQTTVGFLPAKTCSVFCQTWGFSQFKPVKTDLNQKKNKIIVQRYHLCHDNRISRVSYKTNTVTHLCKRTLRHTSKWCPVCVHSVKKWVDLRKILQH